MFSGYVKISWFVIISLILNSCKKQEILPELDLGNNANPNANFEIVKQDSFKVIGNPNKYLRLFASADKQFLNSIGVVYHHINIYVDNFPSASWSMYHPFPGYVQIAVVSGQTITIEYTAVGTDGRESKKSKPYIIIIP